MWWMSAQAAVQGIASFGAASVQKAEAKIASQLSKAQAENANLVRTEANKLAAATGALARWTQSVNNNRRLDQGAKEREAALVNYRRQMDAGVHQRLSESIREAEAMGSAAARQAASGVTGSVGDMVSASIALRDSISRQIVKDRQGMADFDQRRRLANIQSQMVGGLDNSLIFDAIDYNTNVGQTYTAPSPYMAALGAAAPALIGMAKNATNPVTGGKQSPAPITESRPTSFRFSVPAELGSGQFRLD